MAEWWLDIVNIRQASPERIIIITTMTRCYRIWSGKASKGKSQREGGWRYDGCFKLGRRLQAADVVVQQSRLD